MAKINIYRGLEVVEVLPLNAGVFTKRLMAEHILEFNLTSPRLLDIQIGDTLTYNGELMTINQEPEVTVNHLQQYKIRFEGARYTLARYILKDEGALSFSYFGTPEDYLNMLVECLNLVDSGWTIGDVDELDPIALEFDKVNCLDALSMGAEAFGIEWQIVGKEISLVDQVGVATSLEFEYGKGNGLYSLNILHENASKVVTRAYAVGGSENLPAGYTKKKLTLDGHLDDEDAIELYGIREGVIEDLEIFPKRTSTATAVGQINDATWTITDDTIDFDLDGQRISGTEAKIVFKSGALAGGEFKILSYNHSTKTIKYEANKDSNGNLNPAGLVCAEIGDSYTLIGIRMPESYVNAALAQLTTKRAEYLAENKLPRVRYELDIDVLNLRRLNLEPKEGDLVFVKDSKRGINDQIRVTSVSYPAHYKTVLENGMKFTCEVGNEVHYMRVEKVEKEIKKTKEVVESTRNELTEYNRLQSIALDQFRNMVFDPDGNVSQVLIDAIGAIFGADSQNFDLQGVFIKANADDDANKITFTAGQLVHHTYSINGLGNTWEMAAYSNAGLTPTNAYYISAKVSKTALTGEWVLSTTPIGVDDVAGYWHFNLGVISSVIDDQRFTNITKGYTFITGGQILTERLIAQYLQLPLMTIGRNGENVQRFYYDLAQTQTAVSFGVINGKPQLVWYDENGVEIWNASKNGIVYVTNIPESWTPQELLLVELAPLGNESLDVLSAEGILSVNTNYVAPGEVYLTNGTEYFFYDPGTNSTSEANSIYEGYHVEEIKSSSFIPNGWYAKIARLRYNALTDTYGVGVVRYYNGKINSSQVLVNIQL